MNESVGSLVGLEVSPENLLIERVLARVAHAGFRAR
jgi:hypothetical protein